MNIKVETVNLTPRSILAKKLRDGDIIMLGNNTILHCRFRLADSGNNMVFKDDIGDVHVWPKNKIINIATI